MAQLEKKKEKKEKSNCPRACGSKRQNDMLTTQEKQQKQNKKQKTKRGRRVDSF